MSWRWRRCHRWPDPRCRSSASGRNRRGGLRREGTITSTTCPADVDVPRRQRFLRCPARHVLHMDVGDRPSISQARGRLRRDRGADAVEGASTQSHPRRMQMVLYGDGGHGVATDHVRRSRSRSPTSVTTAAVVAETDVVAAADKVAEADVAVAAAADGVVVVRRRTAARAAACLWSFPRRCCCKLKLLRMSRLQMSQK